jgi:Domain of unknown function (DUF4136)
MRLWLTACAVLMLGACRARPTDEMLREGDIVITHYDKVRIEGAYQTYALTSDVPFVREDTFGQNQTTVLSFPELADAMRAKLNARGFRELQQGQGDPDLAIKMTALDSTKSVYSGHYCTAVATWFWSSTCVASYPVYENVEEQLFVIDIADVKLQPGQTRVTPLIFWSTWIYGAISDDRAVLPDKVLTGIEDAFNHSPLLQAR